MWLDRIFYGNTIYEIVFDKEPFIAEHRITDYEIQGDFAVLHNKWIGRNYITEADIGVSVFFDFAEAQKRLNYLRGELNECS